MVIKYQIKFMSLPHDGNGELLTLNIYDATATTGTPVQLTGSASPFSTYESVISGIMPEKATDRPVTLTDASGAVRWAGSLSDLVPAMFNSGELVLNQAQQGNLASQLNDAGTLRNLQLTTQLNGEDILLAIDNHGRRTGKGELVTSNIKLW